MSGSEDSKKELSSAVNSPTVNSDTLAMLLDEVSAMVRAGRPLVAGFADLDGNSLGKLGQAAKVIRAKLEQGMSAADSVAVLSLTYQVPIRVAMEAMAKTGSAEPIQETVRMIRQTNADRRQMRFAFLSPLLNVIVGAAVLFFVMPWILVSLSEAELIKSAFAPSIMEMCQTFASDFAIASLATVVVVGLFSALLFYVASRTTIRNDLQYKHAVFCRWIALQINPQDRGQLLAVGDVELGQVISSSAQVAGPEFAKPWETVAVNIQSGVQSESAMEFPESTPEPVVRCVLDLVTGKRDGAAVGLDLRRLDDLYRRQASSSRTWWTRVWPIGLSWLLMVAFIFILLQSIIAPLWDVVKESLF